MLNCLQEDLNSDAIDVQGCQLLRALPVLMATSLLKIQGGEKSINCVAVQLLTLETCLNCADFLFQEEILWCTLCLTLSSVACQLQMIWSCLFFFQNSNFFCSISCFVPFFYHSVFTKNKKKILLLPILDRFGLFRHNSVSA